MVFYKIFETKRCKKKIHHTADLENESERRIRWRSIRIMYFSMFILLLGRIMTMTGTWPYLNKLDPSAGKEFVGLIMGAGALGQTIFSPIFGYWGNHTKHVRLPLIVALPITALAYVGNALLEIFPTHTVRYWMLFFRFLIGASLASTVMARSYVTEATTLRERTGVISMINLNLMLGIMLGQALQGALTLLGDEGVPLFGGVLWLNMYTIVSWINVAIHLFVVGLFLWPGIFAEQRIAIREANATKQKLIRDEQPKIQGLSKLDYIAIWSVLIAFLVISISIFETLGTSIVMDQFAWSREESLTFMSILMTCGGICNIVVVSVIKPLCRRFDERSLLYIGFALSTLGLLVNIPWSMNNTPQLLITTDATTTNSTALGCPVEKQPWCATAPAMTVTQLVAGYVVSCIGSSGAQTLCQTIFSKVLGPRPQGVWLGVMMSAGCFARLIGPVGISSIYVRLGPVWTFTLTAGTTTLCCIWLRLVRARLVPPRAADEDTRHVEPQELQKLWTDKCKIEIVETNKENSYRNVASDFR